MNFDIKTEQLSDGTYVISLAGEVDLYTAPEFKQQLLEVIGQGATEVIVDFSSTTFIDSTTLGVLVGGVKRLRPNDGRLSLVCSDRNITKIFEITGLDRVFDIYGDRDERRLEASTPSPNLPRPEAAPRTRRCPARLRGRAAAAPSDASRTEIRAAASSSSCRPRSRPSRRAPRATRWPTRGRRARSARTSTTRSRRTRQQGFSEQTITDVVRGQIAYPEEPMPANLYEGQDADDIAVYVAKCSGNPHCGVTAAAQPCRRARRPRRRPRQAAEAHGAGRQGGLRQGRLRRLPHAQGRRLDRQRRPEPRPAEAVRDDRATPGRGRRWRRCPPSRAR